jgi:hypothetical protein
VGPSRGMSATRGVRTVAGPDWAVSASSTVDGSGRVLTRRITMCRTLAGSTRSMDETHRMLLVEPSVALEMQRSTSLDAETLPSYGGVALPEGVTVFLARKS